MTQEGNLPGARFCHFAAGRPLPILLLARFYPIKFACNALTSNSGQSGRGDARSVSSHHTATSSTSCSCKRVQNRPVHRDCILVADLILTSIHWEAEGWIHLAGRPARGTGLQIGFIFLARSPPTLAQASLPPSSSTYSMSSKSHVTTGRSRNDFTRQI